MPRAIHALRYLCLVSAVCLLASTAATAGQLDRLYTCRKVAAAPKIDGVIDPEEWAGTDEASGFTVTTSDAPAPTDSTFRIGYDSKRLYFSMRCDEPNKQGVLAKAKTRDGDVYFDDSIELALDPAHEHMALTKFMVNSLGALFDYQSGFGPWDADAEVAAGGGDGFWSVELAIPFSELGRGTPRHGEVWGLNVFRERYAGGKLELLNWANAYGVFTWPNNLAHLVFQDGNRDLPANPQLHPTSWLNLTPELARHPMFEGRPWSMKEAELDQEQSLRSSFETPHVDMAGPFQERPIRALAFVKMRDWGGDWIVTDTRMRDFVELAQRFNVEPVAVMMTDNGIFGAKAGQRRMRALMMEQYDVYLFVNCSPKDIPADAGGGIAKRVNAGAGIMCVGNGVEWISERGTPTEDRTSIASAFPVKSLANYDRLIRAGTSGVTDGAYPLLATYGIGTGRGAAMLPRGDVHALTPSLDFSQTNLVDYEYWIGLAGAATTWLAGRAAPVRITIPDGLSLRRTDLPSNSSITFSGDGQATAEVFVRDSSGKRVRVLRRDLTVDAGAMTLGVTIPVLAQGDYYLEVRALKGKSVAGFAAAKLTIGGADRIRQVEVDREFFERGETITGSVSLADLSDLRGVMVQADLVTSDDRVLARTDYRRGSSGNLRFAFKAGDDTTPSMRVRVSVFDLLGLVQSKSGEFGVPDRKRGEFNFIMWDTHPDPLGVYSARNMSRAGFNVFLQWPPSPTAVRAGWSAAPYTTRITNQVDAAGNGIPGCWNDEEFAAKEVARVVGTQAEVRKYGVFCYSLGDENDTFHGCLNPKCLDAYRAFLKKQYGAIEALNASWGASYRSFDEVQMLRGDDFRNEDEAFQSGNYPRWFDRQLFMRRAYAGVCARFAAGFRKQDPKAITGFEGAGVFGDDPDAILDAVGMWNTYASVFDDILRTLTPRHVIRGNWMGYAKDADGEAYVAWRAICMGANSLWWWRDDGIGLYRGLLRPTLDLYPAVQTLANEMKPIRNGLGKLLINARTENDGVAVLYSVESALGAQIPSEAPFGQAVAAHTGAIGALKDAGVQFKYVTPRRIAAGALNGVRVLFLPRTIAMDPKTAAAIRSFVQEGGTLIADVRPATFDHHLKALPRGALDDVFGVRQSTRGRMVRLAGPVSLRFRNQTLHLPVIRSYADADCARAGARVCGWTGGTPVLLVHQFGKGNAVLLNFNIACYAAARNRPDAVNLRALILSACELNNTRPRVSITSESGKPVLMMECNFWRSGAAQIMSLRKDMFGVDWAIPLGGTGAAETVIVRLPSPKVVYDLRNGKCLGRVSVVKATPRTGYANFYGLFDAPLTTAKVTCGARPSQGGTALKASVTSCGSETAALLYLVDPSGASPAWSKRVVLLGKDGATASWQLPVGAAGRWTVEATELFTGRTVKAVVVTP
ncbi:MAG: beta-galactosidase trimerization domain-containing protein [Armatimonadota bacterium]|nr:beta-galactosidase trimerization domain-containing protein [Armatimonadota bacterium]